MHLNGCISSNLSDVFPSLPFQDPIVSSLNGSIISGMNLANNSDASSRFKNFSQNGPLSSTNNLFFTEDRSRTNLIINYLPQSFDQTDLQRLFERVGPIRQCKLIRDKNTGASLCYGFVDFVNPQHAALAIQTYHGYETEQKRLRVAYASSGGRRFTPSKAIINHCLALGHRLPNSVNGSTFSNPLSLDVTNENVIGWEVFVMGIPNDWLESDLLRLFSNFGTVVLIKLLPTPNSDSPMNHKSRMSPVMNGTSSDLSSDSADLNKLASATIIFEDKTCAEVCVLRLNGYQPPDWSAPLKLRIIGSVSRETYGTFYFPSRHSPSLSLPRISNGNNSDPLTESDMLSNILSKRSVNSSCAMHGTNQSAFCVPDFKHSDSINNLDIANIVHGNSNFLPSRAIIRNKLDSIQTKEGRGNLNSFDILDLLDNHSNSSNILGNSDRFSNRNTNLLSVLNHIPDHDNSKNESSIKPLTCSQNSPWSFQQNRSVLNSFPESGRSSVMPPQNPTKKLTIRTPLILSSPLSYALSHKGHQINVWLKLENVQPTGSFKIRGIENVCRKWAASGVTHIVCPSNVNSGITAACAAQVYGLTCTLVVPDGSESVIRKRILFEAPETKVIIGGNTFLEAHHRAEQIVNELQAGQNNNSVRLLHPYDQTELWEGYESIIDELSPDLGQPDAIIVGVGGGGLLTGVIQGLWNKGWTSTHVVAVETEGADCLNRSWKSGQIAIIPKSTSIANSLNAPVLAHRTWNLAQCHSISPITCTDSEALHATKMFLDDHGMLVEPACGAVLSTVYSGYLIRLQQEGRIPRPANVVIIVSGGRNISLRQLIDLDTQFSADQVSMIHPNNNYIARSLCADMGLRNSEHDDINTPSTPRPMCTLSNHNNIVDCHLGFNSCDEVGTDTLGGTLTSHDLVNFSKLLGASEIDADEESMARD